MIIDHIRNARLYYSLGEGFKKAFEYLETYDGCASEKADITLDGENVFVKIRPYVTKPVHECSYEAHKEYADIHFVANGREKIGYADVKNLNQLAYDNGKDMLALEGSGEFITLREGYFMITFPDDAHMPCVEADVSDFCGKLIAKVKYTV